jgi:tetratricopeptide (TPR) repeat protein
MMNMRRAILVLLATLMILAASRPNAAANSATTLPDLEGIDVESLSSVPPVDTAIRVFEVRIRQNPADAVSLTMLGDLYSRRAREIGNASDYQRAQTALERALRLLPGYSAAGGSLASVYYSQHDFKRALELASRVYAGDPRNMKALGVIGDAQLALGNYAQAAATYQKLGSQGATPPVLAREAALAEAKGDSQGAFEMMERAAAQALQTGGTPEGVAWYLIRLGDISFATGRLRDAQSYYGAALKVFDGYHLALAGLGKVSGARGQYDDAIAYYQQAIAVLPQPDYLAALGDLYAVTGHPDKAEAQYKTVEYIGKLSALNQQIYNRQLANFLSDHDRHVDQALHLALTELETRKDVYGYDAAAWAAYKNRDLDRAQALIGQALAIGTRDARLYYHAGMIAYDLRDFGRARQLLERALALNPHFSVLQTEQARQTLDALDAQGGE